MNEKGLSVLKALDQVSAKHNASPAAAAIAWLLAQQNITAPIASATSLSQLQTFSSAVNLNLDAEDLKNLDFASEGK